MAVHAGDVTWKQWAPLPEARGLAAPFAGVTGDRLFVAGGANFPDKMPWEGGTKVWHDRIWVLDSPGSTWQEAGRLPGARAYGVGLSINGLWILAGGSDSVRHFAEVWTYEWRDGKLVESAVNPGPLPVALAGAAGAVDADQTAYIACGSSEPGEKKASNRVFCAQFHGEPPRWQELPPLPAEPRILPCAAALGNVFYLFGGAALEEKAGIVSRRYLQDAWSYAPEAGWKRLADLPEPCVAAPSPAPAMENSIYLPGGDDGRLAGSDPKKHPGFSGKMQRYDVVTNTWTAAGRAPAPRVTVPCVFWKDQYVIPSGEVRPGVRSPEVWSFSIPAQK